MLLKRYGNVEFVMSLPAEDGLKLISRAFENDTKDKLYQQYCHISVWMDKDNYMSFSEYYAQATKKVNKVTKQQAYENADNILAMVCKG